MHWFKFYKWEKLLQAQEEGYIAPATDHLAAHFIGRIAVAGDTLLFTLGWWKDLGRVVKIALLLVEKEGSTPISFVFYSFLYVALGILLDQKAGQK